MPIFCRSLLVVSFVGLHSALPAQQIPLDATKTAGIESCRDCHEEMVAAWERSVHATSFTTLGKSELTEKIAALMQIEPMEIPMTASCMRCHYTHESIAGSPQPTEAISCESCHGEALDWIDVHNRKSAPRAARISDAAEHGMVHPQSLAAMVKSCYGCHVVDDEQLVNMAGHPAISDGFEFLSWYSGEVKHNFLVDEGGAVKGHSTNSQEIPQKRKRMLYLTGKLMHLAHTLRAMARAKDPPVDKEGKFIRLDNGRYTFAVQHALEVKRLQKDLESVLRKVAIPEYASALATLHGISFTTGNSDEFDQAATDLFRLAEKFSQERTGESYGAVDSILNNLDPRFSGEN